MAPAAKRAKTSNTPVARKTIDDTARLQFVRSLNALSASQTKFSDSLRDLENFKIDTEKEFDMKLDEKQVQLKELDDEYENKLKRLQIETDMKFAEYQYDTAVDVLEDKNEEPISSDELATLKNGIDTLRETLTDQHDEAVGRLRTDHKKSMEAALNSTELKHQASIADLKAKSVMFEHEITTLQRTIDKLHEEVDAQRELTKAVAEASKTGQIQQSFGKAN